MSELEPNDISKALGQFQLQLNQVLKPLRMYGQGEYVDMATWALIDLAWQLHWRLEGIDQPFEIKELRW